MAKKLTVVLVVIMLIVGFAVGLVSSPFIIAQKTHQPQIQFGTNIQKTKVIQVGTDPTWPPYQERDKQQAKS